jgi:hypothetical protein
MAQSLNPTDKFSRKVGKVLSLYAANIPEKRRYCEYYTHNLQATTYTDFQTGDWHI